MVSGDLLVSASLELELEAQATVLTFECGPGDRSWVLMLIWQVFCLPSFHPALVDRESQVSQDACNWLCGWG